MLGSNSMAREKSRFSAITESWNTDWIQTLHLRKCRPKTGRTSCVVIEGTGTKLKVLIEIMIEIKKSLFPVKRPSQHMIAVHLQFFIQPWQGPTNIQWDDWDQEIIIFSRKTQLIYDRCRRNSSYNIDKDIVFREWGTGSEIWIMRNAHRARYAVNLAFLISALL